MRWGVTGNDEEILNRVKTYSLCIHLFKSVFRDQANAINWEIIKKSISNFILTIQSNNAPYKNFKTGVSIAFNSMQQEGMKPFFSGKFNCSNCHVGNNFSSPSITDKKGDNVYYYNVDENGSYHDIDQCLFVYTKNKTDIDKFRVPTLHDPAFTAPYLHDGSENNLTETINIFLDGGRDIPKGFHKGSGTQSANKYTGLRKINATKDERIVLVSFLLSLSDSVFINNPFVEDKIKRK